MPTLNQIFERQKITLYQNESLDLDHYYQEPYQDEGEEIKEMGEPFETDKSKKRRKIDLSIENRSYSGFAFFMDGSRRTYKIGDMVLEGKKIYPVVVAQVRAGCTEREIVVRSSMPTARYLAKICFLSVTKLMRKISAK